MTKYLIFSDIHFHHTHRFSHITQEGYTVRELEHLSCADDILRIAQEETIDKIVFCGDAWGPTGDTMSGETLACMCEFFNKLKKYPLEVLVGNHDTSAQTAEQLIHKLEFLNYWEGVNIYANPAIIGNCVYMPYCIYDEYAQTFLEKVPDKENKIVFSHLEIKGINLGNGIFTQKGVNLETLKQFKMVFQGHYHSGGCYAKNIQVIGSTQRTSFKDQGISRNNIIIYDDETNTFKRKSFTCPDWLTFTDDNIDEILNIDNNNYVKVDVSTDLLITSKIKEKLDRVKGKDIHIDITRISTNRQVETEISGETEIEVIKQFVNKSDNTEEQKEALVKEGKRLLDKVN